MEAQDTIAARDNARITNARQLRVQRRRSGVDAAKTEEENF